jgi:O-antigen/teichoic acid export membrane protein
MRMLSTSYLNVGAAAIYSIGLVPIVLYFTSVSELGLWTLVTQFTAYLSLVDAGVSSACVRRFVGPITRKEMPVLGGILKTSFIVSLTQGVLCCLIGFLAYPIGLLLGIGPENLPLFSSVLFTQFVLVGIFFLVRPFSALLLAAQRFEVNNLVSCLSIVLSLGIIWIGFRSGLGLWALPLGSLFQQITSTLATAFMVRKLHLLPHSWWRQSSTWKGVSDLFLEALDFFSWSGFATAGATLQSVFLSRFLGLEAVAIWNVGAKLASFAYMLFANLFNTAFMGLSELFERGEQENCLRSFLDLFITTLSCLTIFASCAGLLNDYFILLWTHGQIAFAPSCTWAIFAWLVFAGTLRALACFSNIWQNRKAMRIGPVVEFASLVLLLGLSLFSPSLKWFAFALMASQIPPILLSYGPSFLLVRKFFNVRLSNNQWGTIVFSLAFFISAIGVRAFHASYVPQALLLSFLALPWVYFFLKELKAFMLLRRN